jgi:hypothetical protein
MFEFPFHRKHYVGCGIRASLSEENALERVGKVAASRSVG